MSKDFAALLERVEKLQNSRDVDDNIEIINFQQIDLNSPKNCLNELEKYANSTFLSEQTKLLDIFQNVDSVVDDNEPVSFEIPSLQFLKERFQRFISDLLPIKHPPYPPLCGAIKHQKDKIIKSDTYACIPLGEDYILAYVIGYDKDTKCYHCCDADPEGDEVNVIQVPFDQIIPVPTSCPSKRTVSTTHQSKSSVLALWLNDNQTWTSVFYPAKVAAAPSTSPGIYKLQFDGEQPLYAPVPEKFVIAMP
ncbi:hypothetical protein TVAG_433660 [Trichomonas vaginalis G3]|uniref:SGF29 C-terminal domain-containing protein n=1 Tax=Trichomonas vaginalis (strain ATCC PRA-98 / G3) TaxID=412133 RepID=A2F7R1_TRIV3|nr:methylated histone binding [Trichomonas vaginalis G3]EAX99038.1 hypothetical protein TVAG_433660 [Trichomonas vaginalis G3]KAI5553807.1 methylated histone binding [Trichomonas vaginalis G3]|eukprot:XP_001311968.1 hypothetical protein [Trichomonas vaginalis G3]